MPPLWIGVTFANFQSSGTFPSFKDWFNIAVNGAAIASAQLLTNKEGIPSNPTDLFGFILFICSRTSFLVISMYSSEIKLVLKLSVCALSINILAKYSLNILAILNESYMSCPELFFIAKSSLLLFFLAIYLKIHFGFILEFFAKCSS